VDGLCARRGDRLGRSPLANSVRSCPKSTNSSVNHETTRSVPPYNLGGTLSARVPRWVLIFSGLYRNDPAFRLNMQTIQQGVIWLMVGSAIDQIDLTMPQGSSQAALFVLSRASLPGNESPANALDTFERQRIRRAIGGRLFRHVERQHLRALLRLARSRYFALRSFDRERIAWDRELRSAARVVMYRALRRKVLGPQDVRDPIHQLPDAAGLGRRDHERAIRGVVGAAAGSSRRTFNWTFTLLNDGIPAASQPAQKSCLIFSPTPLLGSQMESRSAI
jgi:hypothetical protein